MRIDAEVTEGRGVGWPIASAGLSIGILMFLARKPVVTPATSIAIALLLTTLSFVALFLRAERPTHSTSSSSRSRKRRRRVGADTRGLTIDGEVVLPRHSIVHTRVHDEPLGGHSVVVEPRGFGAAKIVHVDSARIAQALADTLEHSPHEVAEFEALPPWAHRMRGLTIAMTSSPWILFTTLRHLPSWTVFVVLSLYLLSALPLVVPQWVTVGEDGVLLRWTGRRRFVPFARLSKVRAMPLGVELELDDGRTIEIRLTYRAAVQTGKRTAMLARITAGLERHRALVPTEDEALLTRGERGLDDWIHAMTLLGSANAHGYRIHSIPRERLWAVLENPGADPSARQGAALALRTQLDHEERERLVAIGQKTASPTLRVSIDAVARVAEAPLLRVALEATDEDAPHERRARCG